MLGGGNSFSLSEDKMEKAAGPLPASGSWDYEYWIAVSSFGSSTSTVLRAVCSPASSTHLTREICSPPTSVFSWPPAFKLLSLPCRSVILCERSEGVSWAPAVVDENILENAEFCLGLARGVSV